MSTEYSTQTLDYLGIVAGVCEQIDFIEQIASLLGEPILKFYTFDVSTI